MIVCTSKTCIKRDYCGRQRSPTRVNDKIFDLTGSCCRATGWDLYIPKAIIKKEWFLIEEQAKEFAKIHKGKIYGEKFFGGYCVLYPVENLGGLKP